MIEPLYIVLYFTLLMFSLILFMIGMGFGSTGLVCVSVLHAWYVNRSYMPGMWIGSTCLVCGSVLHIWHVDPSLYAADVIR